MTNIDLSSDPKLASTAGQTEEIEERETQEDFSPVDHSVESFEEAELVESDSTEEDEEEKPEETNTKSYEVPRPALTIDEASSILGKSIRAMERSIAGKWGNKLPEGWHARKMKIDGENEWRIIPPPGFRIKHSSASTDTGTTDDTEPIEPIEEAETFPAEDSYTENETEESFEDSSESKTSMKLPGFGFSIENFLNTASKKAKNEIARVAVGQTEQLDEHPTIVIDRSDDVERLLRELADTQKELAEERKQHMEDMKLIAQLQGSMRLLEDHASQTAIMKEELVETRELLAVHKKQYEEYLNLPWWKRIFKKAP